jgi:hypothetical protein
LCGTTRRTTSRTAPQQARPPAAHACGIFYIKKPYRFEYINVTLVQVISIGPSHARVLRKRPAAARAARTEPLECLEDGFEGNQVADLEDLLKERDGCGVRPALSLLEVCGEADTPLRFTGYTLTANALIGNVQHVHGYVKLLRLCKLLCGVACTTSAAC